MTKEKAPMSANKLSAKERDNAKKEETRLLFEVKKVLSDAKDQEKEDILARKRAR